MACPGAGVEGIPVKPVPAVNKLQLIGIWFFNKIDSAAKSGHPKAAIFVFMDAVHIIVAKAKNIILLMFVFLN
jgi:hypothetical protein